jgi:hypothetical protein
MICCDASGVAPHDRPYAAYYLLIHRSLFGRWTVALIAVPFLLRWSLIALYWQLGQPITTISTVGRSYL